MNGRVALKAAMQRCTLEPRPPHHGLLMLMDGCIFMSSTCLLTHSIMWQRSSGGFDLYLFRVLLLSIRPSSNHRCQLGRRLPGIAQSKKHAEADIICIHFQMEGVKARSATVCLKSAKAL